MALKPLTSKDYKKSRNFYDISMSFLKNPFTKDVVKVENANSIKQAVKNILLTTPGERPFNPNYGSRVSELMFEQMDPFLMDALQVEINNTLVNFEPRIAVQTIRVIPDYDNNAINVSIEYEIVGLPITEQVDFVLQRP